MAIGAVYRSECLILHERENLCGALWLASPLVEDVRALTEQGERGLRNYGGQTILLNIVARRRPQDPKVQAKFSADVRSALIELTKRDELHAAATAHVILPGGLLGMTVRTFLNTVVLVGRPTTPVKVFGDDREAAVWAASLPGPVSWSTQEITGFVQRLDAMRDGRTLPSHAPPE
jgi:hypothetical protein